MMTSRPLGRRWRQLPTATMYSLRRTAPGQAPPRAGLPTLILRVWPSLGACAGSCINSRSSSGLVPTQPPDCRGGFSAQGGWSSRIASNWLEQPGCGPRHLRPANAVRSSARRTAIAGVPPPATPCSEVVPPAKRLCAPWRCRASVRNHSDGRSTGGNRCLVVTFTGHGTVKYRCSRRRWSSTRSDSPPRTRSEPARVTLDGHSRRRSWRGRRCGLPPRPVGAPAIGPVLAPTCRTP
jgi:hypothetical protein